MKHYCRHFFSWALALAVCFLQLPCANGQVSNDSVLLVKARERVNKLTSREFAGRGYQEEGHLKAASWIAAEFRKMGLEPLNGDPVEDNSWFQKFRFSVNLVDSAALVVNGVTLQPGRHYITGSGTGKGKGECKKVTDVGYGLPKDWTKFTGGVAVVRDGLPESVLKDPAAKAKYAELASGEFKARLAIQMKADAVVVLKKKLTAGFSSNPVERPVFEVLDSVWPAKVKSISYGTSAKLTSLYSQNVIGMVRGGQYPDSVIIISAHYDHLGLLNDAVFAGANDNASGVSMMLALAEHFSRPGNRPACSLLFIAFGAEEVGLIGSRHYAEEDPELPLANTKFVLNLDLMGNGVDGITAVAGLDYPELFNRLKEANAKLKAVPEVKGRSNAPNSDHYYFVQKGVKAMFIYTLGGPPHYHDIDDTADHLLLSKFPQLHQLFIAFIGQL